MTEEDQASELYTANGTAYAKDELSIAANGHFAKDMVESHTASNGTDLVHETGVIRTLDGDEAGDEFAQDALNYQILLGKIDMLLENLDLDA